jgi:hypothetical protein
MRWGAGLIGFLLPCAAFAQAPAQPTPGSLHASYETYAAGIQVAEVEAEFSFGSRTYQMNLGFRTTGIVGLVFSGHQFDQVEGSWHGKQAAPSRFVGAGHWHGEERQAEIEYQQGKPTVRVLVPPNAAEREPVPESIHANTIDTLSALAELIRGVRETGRCETTVRTFDGRRAVEIQAHTVGEETLEPTSRSSFTGKAMRCDFAGRMLAGFKFGDNRERDSKPMHGSAWLAPTSLGGPLLPVRMVFETRWFGDATMYLTGVGPGSDLTVARGN